MPAPSTHTEVKCGTCGWESVQPQELVRRDGQHHADTNGSHAVLATTTTVEWITGAKP